MNFKKMLVLVGVLVLVGAVLAACGGTTATEAPTTAATEAPVVPVPDTPYLADWQGSAHANVADEPFRHWDDAAENPDGVPTSCVCREE